ncbi:MAG: ferrochelatase [Coriobacteriia bacterium]|nr:ferrochelatase [Coriobacteriia bacterium]
MPRTGVVLMGFGGPDCLDAIAPFMRNLTGRKPSPELVKRVTANYAAIGGASPLAGIARQIASALERTLRESGHDMLVRVGMAYWHPFIGEAVAELSVAGCDRVIAVSLSPFESRAASGAYRHALGEAARECGIAVVEAPLVSATREFAEFFANEARSTLMSFGPADRVLIVFSAHSLPVADLAEPDPYIAGLRGTAEAVAEKLGAVPWLVAYQSKGQRPGEWLAPSLDAVMEAASADGTMDGVIVCPIGFLTDHMETLFDLDIVVANKARDLGLKFARCAVPNDDPRVTLAMARQIEVLLQERCSRS